MAARFWVGGTGSWDASDTTHWSGTSGGGGGSSVPGASDTVTFDAASGGGTVTVTATQSVTSITGGAFTGTLNTNGQSVTTSGAFNFSGAGTRTLTLGASTITCQSWTVFNTSGLTFNANTSTLTLSGSASGGAFQGGGRTYNIVTCTSTVDATIGLLGTNTFATLTLTGNGSKASGFFFTGGVTTTVTGTLTLAGISTINRILVSSDVVGAVATLSAATVTTSYSDFQDITAAGAASWNLSAITGNSGDTGGNTGITFTSPANQHWLNASSSSWSTVGNWTSRIPLPQDDVFMDKAFGTSQTVTADMPRLGKSIDWTGATYTTALSFTISISTSNYGSLTLITGMTMSANQAYAMRGRSAYTLTTAGVTVAGQGIHIHAPSGTVQFQDDVNFTTGNGINLTSGTLDANNKNVTIPFYTVNTQVGSLTRSILLGSGLWTLTGTVSPQWNVTSASGLTVTASTSTIKITDTANGSGGFTGGGLVYNNLWFSRGASTGNLTIVGSNTFADFKDDGTAAHTILFTAASTTTVATFTVSGTPGNLITITSTTSGTHTLTKTGGGIVSRDYLNIQHSLAKPGNWYAGLNSVDNQSTSVPGSGWIFNIPPIPNKVSQLSQAVKRAAIY